MVAGVVVAGRIAVVAVAGDEVIVVVTGVVVAVADVVIAVVGAVGVAAVGPVVVAEMQKLGRFAAAVAGCSGGTATESPGRQSRRRRDGGCQ